MKLSRRRRRAAPARAVPPRPFDVHAEPTGYGLLVTVAGELDIATAPQLREVLGARSPAALVVVDLSGVTFMDSSGLGVIVRAHQALSEERSRLALVCPPGPARLLLDVSGLEAELPVFATLDEALRA